MPNLGKYIDNAENNIKHHPLRSCYAPTIACFGLAGFIVDFTVDLYTSLPWYGTALISSCIIILPLFAEVPHVINQQYKNGIRKSMKELTVGDSAAVAAFFAVFVFGMLGSFIFETYLKPKNAKNEAIESSTVSLASSAFVAGARFLVYGGRKTVGFIKESCCPDAPIPINTPLLHEVDASVPATSLPIGVNS